MSKQEVVVCDTCDNRIGEINNATTVDVDSMEDTLHYCNPMCMMDDWRGRLDWYVEDR